MEQNPRYIMDPDELIKLALNNGLSKKQIVINLTRGEIYARVRALAEKYAASLGITEAEFVKMAGRRSTPRKGA